MKKILLMLIMMLLLTGCNKEKELDIKEIMKENDYVIIDVRTKEEYEELHVIDSIKIPYDKIDENINIEKEKVIFVYCRSGNRSNIAYQKLTNLGYTVYDLGAIDNIDLEKE